MWFYIFMCFETFLAESLQCNLVNYLWNVLLSQVCDPPAECHEARPQSIREEQLKKDLFSKF